MNATVIPTHILKLMSREQRKNLGRAGLTPDEVEHIVTARLEETLQKDMMRLLDQRGIFFNRARMDKKTTVRVGMFDFTVYLPSGKFLAVEAKAPGGGLSIFQRKLFTEFWEKTGQVVHIVQDLAGFQKLLDDQIT